VIKNGEEKSRKGKDGEKEKIRKTERRNDR
jgi:hypothetical protein